LRQGLRREREKRGGLKFQVLNGTRPFLVQRAAL